MSCEHKHKVSETRKRSLLKTISGRILEILIGTTVFGTILFFLGFPSPYQLGFALNLLEELICLKVTYLTERIWNRIQWGRKIENINKKRE